jgi:Ca2+-binding EF-hand superfamily protein
MITSKTTFAFIAMLAVASGLAACAGLSGCAGLGRGGRELPFHRLDKDGDGVLSRDELPDGINRTAFDSVDENKDGVIDWSEWSRADREAGAKERFNAIDADKNTRISFLEFSDAANKSANFDEMFSVLDKDRDGSISPDEFSARPSFRILSIKF